MIWLLSVLAFLVIFSLLILIHEFGHFYAAKKFGVKVEEFGLGMPPKLWGFKPKKSETTYTINAIPFGGFVRLYGEDSHDAKVLKNNRSFAAKPVWQKLIIIAAGVVMNFLLAFVLLVIGFTWGMQPLILNSSDAFAAIKSGVIKLQEVEIGKEGVDKNALLSVPKLVVKDAEVGNSLELRTGQMIERVNGELVFSLVELQKQLALPGKVNIEVKSLNLPVVDDQEVGQKVFYPVVISQVILASNAEKSGLLESDSVISINGVEIQSVEALSKALQTEMVKENMVYKVQRGQAHLEFIVPKDANGLIGVMLSPVVKLDQYQASFYVKSVAYSVLKIEDVKYPFWQAPGQALREMGRLSVLTIEMFGNVFSSLFTRLSVPEGVAGPIGIAQMTFVFVQEGLMSLIRFTALLSLSLAIINILPFPGLDGGRFFLIIIPLILRRKMNPKLEAMIHLFGFMVLMLLILLVTFNDIGRLFGA